MNEDKTYREILALLCYSLPHLAERNLVKHHEKSYYMTEILGLGLNI